MSFFNSNKPRVIVESTGVPVVQEITTTTTPIIKRPIEKAVYSSHTVSYATPHTQPKLVSHNEYKYNSNYTTTTATTTGIPTKSAAEFINNTERISPVFFETLPLQSNSNNIFELAPPHDEAMKITYNPKIELYSTATFAILMMDLPGVSKENLTVELEKGLLKISGHKEKPKLEELEKDNEFHTKIVERSSSYYFYKLFQMPPAFSEGQNISCKLNNGELVIKILANELKTQKLVINIE